MPAGGARIGSGRGIQNFLNLGLIIEQTKVPVLVDAGVGTASDAVLAMEFGCDAVLMNTAIAEAQDPIRMASAMKHAVIAGREAYLAGRMPKRLYAEPSSPLSGDDLGRFDHARKSAPYPCFLYFEWQAVQVSPRSLAALEKAASSAFLRRHLLGVGGEPGEIGGGLESSARPAASAVRRGRRRRPSAGWRRRQRLGPALTARTLASVGKPLAGSTSPPTCEDGVGAPASTTVFISSLTVMPAASVEPASFQGHEGGKRRPGTQRGGQSLTLARSLKRLRAAPVRAPAARTAACGASRGPSALSSAPWSAAAGDRRSALRSLPRGQ